MLNWLEPTEAGRARRFALRWARWSDDLFANWADFPSVVAGGDGVLLAHWLRRGKSRHAYDIVLARSADDGQSWTQLGTPHRDGTATEHGFVSIVPEPDGAFALFWLDGRAMSAGTTPMRFCLHLRPASQHPRGPAVTTPAARACDSKKSQAIRCAGNAGRAASDRFVAPAGPGITQG
jgi:hypothetical protein